MTSALAEGEWRDKLPGERALCDLLGVSRPVMRDAFRLLEKAGLIACTANHPRRILAPKPPSRNAGTTVVFLLGANGPPTEPSGQRLLNEVREKLARFGMETEICSDPLLECASAPDLLAAWAAACPPDTRWVLLSVSEAVQRWFARREHPALVVGTAYPEVRLPSFDTDHRAVGRHAVGRFLAGGHRRIALVTVKNPRAGDIESEAGFLEGCQLARNGTVQPTVIRTKRDPDDLCRLLRQSFRQAHPPTALFVCHAQLALTALTFLQSSGRHVPRDVGLISRDHGSFLDFTRPFVPHYRHNEATFARQLVRLILSIPSFPQARRIIPRFVASA